MGLSCAANAAVPHIVGIILRMLGECLYFLKWPRKKWRALARRNKGPPYLAVRTLEIQGPETHSRVNRYRSETPKLFKAESISV